MSATHFKMHNVRNKMRTPKRRPKGAVKGDINVTPLVDVVLVLLIIFMVVTPMIANGMPVEMPQTMHHDKKPDEGKDIIVSVTRDKSVFFGTKKTTTADLGAQIENEKRRFPEKSVYLKGDRNTTYGAVREVMEAIHKTGVDDVRLGTDEVKMKE